MHVKHTHTHTHTHTHSLYYEREPSTKERALSVLLVLHTK